MIGAPPVTSPGTARSAHQRSTLRGSRPRSDTISPDFKNASETTTASSNMPPGLERRSMIYPKGLLPTLFLMPATAATTSAPVCSEKPVTEIMPMRSFTSHCTGFRSIIARVSVTSNGPSRPGRKIVSLILVPGAPRMASTASSKVPPTISLPSR